MKILLKNIKNIQKVTGNSNSTLLWVILEFKMMSHILGSP